MSNDNKSPEIEKSKLAVAAMFGRAASTYDRVGPRFFCHFGRRLVEVAQIPQGAKVLDVATGTGAVLLPAIDAVGSQGYITGIDLSEEMVHKASEEIRRLKIGNAQVLQMDAEYLQFPDDSFDCVLCGFSVFFFPQRDRAFSEMHRVLRPQGRIAITTWGKQFVDYVNWFNDLVAAHLSARGKAEPMLESKSTRPSILDSPEELTSVLIKAGFIDVQVASETAEFVYADENEWWSSLWSHGMRVGLERVEKATGATGLEEFKASVFDQLGPMRRETGIPQVFETLFALASKS
jgi:ubiquinone/menaquinone biosynthesis C-methylase UbiE